MSTQGLAESTCGKGSLLGAVIPFDTLQEVLKSCDMARIKILEKESCLENIFAFSLHFLHSDNDSFPINFFRVIVLRGNE